MDIRVSQVYVAKRKLCLHFPGREMRRANHARQVAISLTATIPLAIGWSCDEVVGYWRINHAYPVFGTKTREQERARMKLRAITDRDIGESTLSVQADHATAEPALGKAM